MTLRTETMDLMCLALALHVSTTRNWQSGRGGSLAAALGTRAEQEGECDQ